MIIKEKKKDEGEEGKEQEKGAGEASSSCPARGPLIVLEHTPGHLGR